MGIKVEFNPDLALRNFSEFQNGNRQKQECIPEKIAKGQVFEFLKEGGMDGGLASDHCIGGIELYRSNKEEGILI